MVGDLFYYHHWGEERVATGIYWAEARNAAKCSTLHRTAPTANKRLTEKVSHPRKEKALCYSVHSVHGVHHGSCGHSPGITCFVSFQIFPTTTL